MTERLDPALTQASPRVALLHPAPGRQICVPQRRPQTTQPSSRAPPLPPPNHGAAAGTVRAALHPARPVSSGCCSWVGSTPVHVLESQERLDAFMAGKQAPLSPRKATAGPASPTKRGS